jgi:hypothetical protein
MRMVMALGGGGILAVLMLYFGRMLMGLFASMLAFAVGMLFKLVLLVLLVWLGVKLLRTLVPPRDEHKEP